MADHFANKTPVTTNHLRQRLEILCRGTGVYDGLSDFLDQLDTFHDVLEAHGLLDNEAPSNTDPIPSIETLTKFVGGENRLNAKHYRLIVQFLFARRQYHSLNRGNAIEESFPDSLFHALLGFLDIGDITLANLTDRAPGLYRAFRPSSTFPGHFWEGLLDITADAQTGAVRTSQYYHASDRFDRPARSLRFDGFMIRKAQQYVMLSRNRAKTSLEVVYLPTVTLDENRLQTMMGAVTDMGTARLYSSRQFYERHDIGRKSKDKALQDILATLDLRTPEEMPPSILHYFRDDPIPGLTMY